MKILIAHNAYQHAGGEDTAVDAEIALLREHGHAVRVYRRHNDELASMAAGEAALNAVWSQRTVREAAQICIDFQPDLIHVHNTFPLISPSLYWLASRRHVPLVQTLHNFRLLCPQATFLRQDKVCEDCLGKAPWRAVGRKCYRQSTLQSAVAAGMLTLHRTLGTYSRRVTRYIALNRFCLDKFIAGGLPPDLLRIKPNFVAMNEEPCWDGRSGGLFIGRLSPEKGLAVLAAAAAKLDRPALRVVGAGPLEPLVRHAFGPSFLGQQSPQQVRGLLQSAQYLVSPSICYETFGLVAIEAFASGTPVIASRHGALGELVREGLTGLLFEPGNAAELAEKIAWADSHPVEMQKMGRAARTEYEAKYTPSLNYHMLINIYQEAIMAVRGNYHAA
jgi:glycosyltransferase involved in cell wall biosynthesis